MTFGGPAEDSGVIDAPIARRPLPSLLREIREDGKPSVTRFRVLERGEQVCKLSLEPVTGRTHQLRLHCMHMGFPILGDPQYNNPDSAAFSEKLGLKYQLLCAKELEFLHPVTGRQMKLQSNMNAELPTG
jgi:23S rRNA-/tRNA-specific pseudouridylate synthase